MWKVLVGFIIFAAVSLFVIFKAGDKVSMQGEAGGHAPAETVSAAESPTTPPAPLIPAPASPASATELPAAPASDAAASK